MRNLSFLLLAFLLLNAFVADKPSNEKMLEAYNLSCYKMKSKTVNHSDYNIWVVTNKASLEENFIADSCTNDLDFDNNLVVALKLETETSSYKVSFTRITRDATSINIYFTTKRLKSSFEESSPLEIAEVARDKSVKRVNFYHGTMLVKSVPVVNVY